MCNSEDAKKPAAQYILTKSGGERAVQVTQYVDDIDVTQSIDYFLKFCQDMGWNIETPGT